MTTAVVLLAAIVALVVAAIMLVKVSKSSHKLHSMVSFFCGFAVCSLILGAVVLWSDAHRKLETTQIVRAIDQLEDLASSGHQSAVSPALLACRTDFRGGATVIHALGRLNAELFDLRRKFGLVDANGQPRTGAK